jgi:hypothetical protein
MRCIPIKYLFKDINTDFYFASVRPKYLSIKYILQVGRRMRIKGILFTIILIVFIIGMLSPLR